MSKTHVNRFIMAMVLTVSGGTGAATGNRYPPECRLGDTSAPVFSAQTSGVEASPTSDPLWTDSLWHADEKGIRRFSRKTASCASGGWIDGGYTYNASSPSSNFNGPYNAIDRDIPVLNQLYMIVEAVDGDG